MHHRCQSLDLIVDEDVCYCVAVDDDVCLHVDVMYAFTHTKKKKGGGAGIGTAICRRFVLEGAKVWVADINQEGAESTARDITSSSQQQGVGKATAIIVSLLCFHL